MRSRRGRAGVPRAGPSRRAGGAPSRGCRGGPRRPLRRGAQRAGGGQTLGHAAGVHEDEGRTVLLDLARDLREHLAHLLARSDRLELAARQHDLEIEGPAMAHVDDRAARLALRVDPIGPDTDEELRNALDRTLRRREPDPRRRLIAERLEPLERKGEMGAALVAGQRVDLVDDDRPHGPQDLAPPRRGQQEVERLGGRHEDLRRGLHERRPGGRRGIPAAQGRPGSPAPAGPSRGRSPRSPAAVARDSPGCPPRGPSAARRRRPRHRADGPCPAPRGTAGSASSRKGSSGPQPKRAPTRARR
jgi:hypothetical protein